MELVEQIHYKSEKHTCDSSKAHAFELDLAELFIVSAIVMGEGEPGSAKHGVNFPNIAISAGEAPGTKCPRCWAHSIRPNVDGLCPRCAEVVSFLK